MITDAVPLIRASQVRPFLAAMDHIGAPRERFLRESKLPLLAYDDTGAAVPDLFLWALADRVARSEGIEDFARLTATHMPIWESEPEFIGWLSSLPTLWIALSRLCHMTSQFGTSVQVQITREGDQALLKCYPGPNAPGRDQAELYDLQLLIQIVQLAAGQEWAPSEIFVSELNARRLTGREECERVRIQTNDL